MKILVNLVKSTLNPGNGIEDHRVTSKTLIASHKRTNLVCSVIQERKLAVIRAELRKLVLGLFFF